LREGIFTIDVGILLFGALAYAFMSKAGSFSGVLAIALIFSAGFSNLLDRISYGGLVVISLTSVSVHCVLVFLTLLT
jgi:lipoprotein signal peptidase